MLTSWKKKADRLKVEYFHAKHQVRDEKIALSEAEQCLEDSLEAQQIIQRIAQKVQQIAHARVASIVTKCLQAIFPDPYEFKIIFDRKRGKTEARLVFIKNDEDVNPLLASGGGPVDVASFALRLACIVLSQPAPRRLIVLDEPFKMVSRDNSEKLGVMLSRLSSELQVQFVIVTHNESLQMGKVIEIS